jgi:acyl transferase domain-containing protein
MQVVAGEYAEMIGALSAGNAAPSAVPMLSSVSGVLVKEKELCRAEYWVQNMVSPVLFSYAVSKMCALKSLPFGEHSDGDLVTARGVSCLVEIGPHCERTGCCD